MGHLGYPVNQEWTAAVTAAAERLAKYGSSIAEERVIDYLDKLDNYLAAIDSGAGDANLIQADVLKWRADGNQLTGYREEYTRIQRLLAQTLDLSIYRQEGAGSGGNRLSRS